MNLVISTLFTIQHPSYQQVVWQSIASTHIIRVTDSPQNIAINAFSFPKQGHKRVKELWRQKPGESKRDQINKLMPVL